MKIFHTYREFMDLTHPLKFEEFDDLKIKPDRAIGLFHPSQYAELVQFCAANPKYHVMSGFWKPSYLFINAPLPHATLYYLCSGDSDPELVWFSAVTEERRQLLKIAEFNSNK